MSSAKEISPAVTTPGPIFSSVRILLPLKSAPNIIFLIFNAISITSSLTPEIDENSCKTPSILNPVSYTHLTLPTKA